MMQRDFGNLEVRFSQRLCNPGTRAIDSLNRLKYVVQLW
jgi:hypothetical protein